MARFYFAQACLGVLFLGMASCTQPADKARKLLEEGDWGGAHNVLTEANKGGGGSVEERALLLFSMAAPDAAHAGADFWFLKACALDQTAASYILTPSSDEQEKVDRLRNDMRRQLKDKGVDTSSVDDYAAVLRATAHYGLTAHTWKPDQAMIQGAVGLCGLWLGEPGADKALLASLGSQGALSKGSERYFAVAGDRIIDPLRAVANNKDDLASGPAMDILQTLLEPVAQQTIAAAVEKPQLPRDYAAELASQEDLRPPVVRAPLLSSGSMTAMGQVRQWFNLGQSSSSGALSGWSGQTLKIKEHKVDFSWTWDQQAGAGKLYGLTWTTSDWTRLTFDGQDPLTAPGQVVIGLEPATAADNGDFALNVITGVGEQTEVRSNWNGPEVVKTRGIQTERRVYRLEGASATLVVPPPPDAAPETR